MAQEPFQLEYVREAAEDLRQTRPFDQKKLLDEIEAHLKFEPTKASRSRIKEMSQPFWSQFRLRLEDFRVISMWT